MEIFIIQFLETTVNLPIMVLPKLHISPILEYSPIFTFLSFVRGRMCVFLVKNVCESHIEKQEACLYFIFLRLKIYRKDFIYLNF